MKQMENNEAYEILCEKMKKAFSDGNYVSEIYYQFYNDMVNIEEYSTAEHIALSSLIDVVKSNPLNPPIMANLVRLILKYYRVNYFTNLQIFGNTLNDFRETENLDEFMEQCIINRFYETMTLDFLQKIMQRMGYNEKYQSIAEIASTLSQDLSTAYKRYRALMAHEADMLYYGIFVKILKKGISDWNDYYEPEGEFRKLYERVWKANRSMRKTIIDEYLDNKCMEIVSDRVEMEYYVEESFKSVDQIIRFIQKDESGALNICCIADLNDPFLNLNNLNFSFRNEVEDLLGMDIQSVFYKYLKSMLDENAVASIVTKKREIDRSYSEKDYYEFPEKVKKYMTALVKKEEVPSSYIAELLNMIEDAFSCDGSGIINDYIDFCDCIKAGDEGSVFTQKTMQYLWEKTVQILSGGMRKKGFQENFQTIQDIVRVMWQSDPDMSADEPEYFSVTYLPENDAILQKVAAKLGSDVPDNPSPKNKAVVNESFDETTIDPLDEEDTDMFGMSTEDFLDSLEDKRYRDEYKKELDFINNVVYGGDENHDEDLLNAMRHYIMEAVEHQNLTDDNKIIITNMIESVLKESMDDIEDDYMDFCDTIEDYDCDEFESASIDYFGNEILKWLNAEMHRQGYQNIYLSLQAILDDIKK